MPWKECDAMSLRKEFIEKYIENVGSFADLCRLFEISRKTGYKWIRRYQSDGVLALDDYSKRPYSFPNKTNNSLVDLILERRDEFPEWGGRKLRKVLLNEGYKDIPSEATLNRILKTHGRITASESEKRKKCIRFEYPNANALWQIDFKGHFPLKEGRCHPLSIIDDYSRFVVCLRAFSCENSEYVKGALEDIFTEYGLPEAMTMDNGPQWKTGSWLFIWLMRLGIRTTHSRPYHPQTQGKDERFHRTLKTELLKYRLFPNIEMAQKNFDEWLELYNFKRPHDGIGLLCPCERYVKSNRPYKKDLPAIEYGPEDIVRKVRSCGQVSYKGKNYFVGEYLKGEYVALRQMMETSLEIYFVNTRVGRINL